MRDMKIGIDVSQMAYHNTGVANYLKSLVEHLLELDSENEYVLFFSSMRKKLDNNFINGLTSSRVSTKTYKFPPKILDLLWNRLHIAPIEWFVGDVDVFITSDWTEPPTKKARKATIIYDMVVFKYPEETASIIQKVQKRKLEWVKKESDKVFTISESAKKDIEDILDIDSEKIKVIYPGVTL